MTRRILVAAVAIVSLAAAGSASANPLVHWRKSWTSWGHATAWHPSKHHAKHARARQQPTVAPTHLTPTANRTVQYVAYSDNQRCFEPGWDPRPEMAAHDANVYRLVGPDDARLQTCAQNVKRYGIRLYVSLRYDDRSTPAEVAGQVQQALAYTGPVWAFSVGNEEDLGYSAYGVSTQNYRTDWAAAEPIVAKIDPGALRVEAEVSPWHGVAWAKQLGKLPGAQVYAMHCYDIGANGGLQTAPVAAAIMAKVGLPTWCSEMAPDLASVGSPAWLKGQTLASWEARTQYVVNSAPNLQMTAYYRWPQLGAYARRLKGNR